MALAISAGLKVTAIHVDHGLRPESALEADIVAGIERLAMAHPALMRELCVVMAERLRRSHPQRRSSRSTTRH